MTPQARGLSPTDGLLRILPELRASIEQADKLFRPYVFEPQTLRGRFRLVSRGLAAPEILAYVIPRLAKEAPGLVLEHRPRTGSVWEEVEEGIVDLALVTDRSVPASFRSVPLFDIELGMLMRRGHPLAEKYLSGGLSMTDVMNYKRISMDVSSDYRHASWDRQLFGGESFADKGVVCTSASAVEMAATIAVSDLIMFAPEFGSRGLRRHYGLTWVPLPNPAPKLKHRHGILVWREALHRDPAHMWIRSLFRDWAESVRSEPVPPPGL